MFWNNIKCAWDRECKFEIFGAENIAACAWGREYNMWGWTVLFFVLNKVSVLLSKENSILTRELTF